MMTTEIARQWENYSQERFPRPAADRIEEIMAEEQICLMTVFDGRADSQSLDNLNRLLDEGWRIAGISPFLQRLPGVGNFKAFLVEMKKPLKDSE